MPQKIIALSRAEKKTLKQFFNTEFPFPSSSLKTKIYDYAYGYAETVFYYNSGIILYGTDKLEIEKRFIDEYMDALNECDAKDRHAAVEYLALLEQLMAVLRDCVIGFENPSYRGYIQNYDQMTSLLCGVPNLENAIITRCRQSGDRVILSFELAYSDDYPENKRISELLSDEYIGQNGVAELDFAFFDPMLIRGKFSDDYLLSMQIATIAGMLFSPEPNGQTRVAFDVDGLEFTFSRAVFCPKC